MPYKVLDIYRDLPNTNCGDCGRSGCFAFATVVYLEGEPLEKCPHLTPEKLASMQQRLDGERNAGGGKKDASHVQALAFLKDKIKDMDFASMAEKSGARHNRDEPASLELEFLGQTHRVTAGDVTVTEGEPPSVWVKVFLYIYLTRANGNPPEGRWIAYRELPNTVSKRKNFEDVATSVAEHFGGDVTALNKVLAPMGAEPTEFGSTEYAWRIPALPRVDIVLLYWPPSDEFGARSTVLLDAGVLDYLDQEAAVFLVEAFAKRARGEAVAEVIP